MVFAAPADGYVVPSRVATSGGVRAHDSATGVTVDVVGNGASGDSSGTGASSGMGGSSGISGSRSTAFATGIRGSGAGGPGAFSDTGSA